jgi:nucleoside-diphosphate-sugar epimerase
MKIFLTGSSGFLGQNLAKKLEEKYEVHYMTNDLLDHGKVRQELFDADPDIIVRICIK